MKRETATYAKTHFGEILDNARREPVLIQKSGRNVAVVVSYEDYKAFEELEDRYWAEQAMQAKQTGMLSAEDSEAFLKEMMDNNEED